MSTPSNTDPDLEPSRPKKRFPWPIVLKTVFKGVSLLMTIYKFITKAVDFFNSSTD